MFVQFKMIVKLDVWMIIVFPVRSVTSNTTGQREEANV